MDGWVEGSMDEWMYGWVGLMNGQAFCLKLAEMRSWVRSTEVERDESHK